MKLHTVFITYNRLELTKRAISSYLESVTVPFSVTIVDNGSSDGTQEWLKNIDSHYVIGGAISEAVLMPENRYPGAACNYGWSLAPWDATHLHRADNDFAFLPDWCVEVQRRFRYSPKLGQLGLRTNEEELHNTNNVGGNCIIKRELWELGLRYDERPWPQIAVEVGTGWSEDGLFSPAVKQMGYQWGRVKRRCLVPLASGDFADPYYAQSFGDRGIEQ